jgi:hypothetical protein
MAGFLGLPALAALGAERAALRDWLTTSGARLQAARGVAESQPAFLRLPLEAARKLRWYDREDLSMLIDLHLREKQELLRANEALRAVLRARGGGGPALEAQLRAADAAVDAQRAADGGVAEVLVLAARAEVERLREHAAGVEAQLAAAQRRLAVRPAGGAEPAAPRGDGGAAGAGSPAAAALAHLLAALKLAEGGPPPTPLVLEAIAALSALAPGGGEGGVEAALRARCAALEEQTGKLSGALAAAHDDAGVAQAAAKRQLAEARARAAEAQRSQQDLLRMTQEARLGAEARAEEAEQRAAQGARRVAQAEQLLGAAQADAQRWKEETRRAESAALRSRDSPQADAAQKALRQARARVAELEAAATSAQRQAATTHARVVALESRLGAAEAEAARAVAVARDLEAAAAERDELAALLAGAESRTNELRAQHLGAAGLRELAEQSEGARARAEEELVTTARLAAQLEARLAAAQAEIEHARLAADRADARAAAAEAAVEAKAAERWASAGRDRAAWPPAAAEELEGVEARLAASLAAQRVAREEAATAAAAADAARRDVAAAEQRADAAQAAAELVRGGAEQREARLHAAASAAVLQVDEFRTALAASERERDELREQVAARAAAVAVVSAATRRAGSRGLEAVDAGGGGVPAAPLRPGVAPDALYLKNVILKFAEAAVAGRHAECEVLLPAVAALLRASPGEYRALRAALRQAQDGFGWIYSLGASPTK